MSIRSFLKLVEINTKLASMIPLILGTVYVIYRFNEFRTINFILFFIALLLIDMTTTALNNYFDYKRALKKQGYNYETHNAIVSFNLSDKSVITTIAVMLLLASLLGIALVIRTNIAMLFIGGISFFIGIVYSFGPLPISRTPFGEFLSGLFMGFVIVFLSVYIHIYDLNVLSVSFQDKMLFINLDTVEMVYIFILSVPTMVCIANIMLANNICDMEDDIENKRYTLPIFIGKRNAILLFNALYVFAYAAIIAMLILRLVPVICVLVLLTLIPVLKNLSIFRGEQVKSRTFILSVKNLIIITIPMILLTALWCIGDRLIF